MEATKIISIHALLAESDRLLLNKEVTHGNFYPRSPCGERLVRATVHTCRDAFLSTLSLRRATTGIAARNPECFDFYPRSPCGERLRVLDGSKSSIEISIHALLAESDTEKRFWHTTFEEISIHALLAESDLLLCWMTAHTCRFLSTLSLRRATAKVHKTVGHFCAYETNFMEIASSC